MMYKRCNFCGGHDVADDNGECYECGHVPTGEGCDVAFQNGETNVYVNALKSDDHRQLSIPGTVALS